MIFKENFKVLLKDIGKENYIKNIGILEIFENIGTHHSDLAGYGPNDIEEKELPKLELEVPEDNNLKTYLDDTIDLNEVIKEIKENDSKWRKRSIFKNH